MVLLPLIGTFIGGAYCFYQFPVTDDEPSEMELCKHTMLVVASMAIGFIVGTLAAVAIC